MIHLVENWFEAWEVDVKDYTDISDLIDYIFLSYNTKPLFSTAKQIKYYENKNNVQIVINDIQFVIFNLTKNDIKILHDFIIKSYTNIIVFD
jgi:hypothetical protein